jgi:hypothetical protein
MRPMSGGAMAAAACCLIIGRLAEALHADQNSPGAKTPGPAPKTPVLFTETYPACHDASRALGSTAITTAQAPHSAPR